MIFSRNPVEPPDVLLALKGIFIKRVLPTKFLGVMIDSKLMWKSHIDYICTKLSKVCGILSKARKVLSKDTLKSLYFTFAYPYFIYCIHVWGNTCATYIEK